MLSPRRFIASKFLQGSLLRQTKLLLWGGFGGLLLLLSVLGLSAITFLYQIEREQDRINHAYMDREKALEQLRASIYLSGTYVRGYLLDPTEPPAEENRKLFEEQRTLLTRALNDGTFRELKPELNRYLSSISAVFHWTPEERQRQGHSFAQNEVLPRRMRLLSQTDRIENQSERESERSRALVSEKISSFRWRLVAMLACSVALGLVLAGVALWRILNLERESQTLSNTLLTTEENERRKISRELHDEVGQNLYAAMLGLGNLRSAIKTSGLDESLEQLQRVEEITGRTVTVVRNISLMLRPAMLDDLGLLAALKWLARETTRTQSIDMVVDADPLPEDFLESLPEEHRTCIFRVVQEAVHNTVRHARATQIRAAITRPGASFVRVQIQDNGRGFDSRREPGLGILGMRERVARLGGLLRIQSELERGTTVSFELPIPGQEIRPLRTA